VLVDGYGYFLVEHFVVYSFNNKGFPLAIATKCVLDGGETSQTVCGKVVQVGTIQWAISLNKIAETFATMELCSSECKVVGTELKHHHNTNLKVVLHFV
jgi:hypothetical protein